MRNNTYAKLGTVYSKYKGYIETKELLEQKIYEKMKKWEARHPITGIVLCTISGGIFISLVAGIVLEAIMMTI